MDPAVTVFYPEDININPFMGAGALATAIDDFNGDNFEHSGLGFVGGAYIKVATTGDGRSRTVRRRRSGSNT